MGNCMLDDNGFYNQQIPTAYLALSKHDTPVYGPFPRQVGGKPWDSGSLLCPVTTAKYVSEPVKT